MSFMTVRGKIFICSQCEKSLTIEYQGGAQMTQIGDMEVYRQQELSQRLGQPSADPEREGYYMYDIGLCAECYSDVIRGINSDREKKVFSLIDSLNKQKKSCLGDIEEIISNISMKLIHQWDLNMLQSILGKKFGALLNDKHMAKSKREKQIRDLLRKRHFNLESSIIEEAFQNEAIQKLIADYEELTHSELSQLEKLLLKEFYFFEPKKTNEAENLNDYILSDLTVRYPEDDSIEETFYFEQELDNETTLSSFVIDLENFDYELDMKKISDVIYGQIEKLKETSEKD